MQDAMAQARRWLEGQVKFLEGRIRNFRLYNRRCRHAAWVLGAGAAAFGFAPLLPGAANNLYIVAIALLAQFLKRFEPVDDVVGDLVLNQGDRT